MVYEPDGDDAVFVCTECKSDQPEGYLERSPFAAMGAPVPCKFCGGVCIEVLRKHRDTALKQALRERGLS